jgi:uncharacterized protein (DUF924 family)
VSAPPRSDVVEPHWVSAVLDFWFVELGEAQWWAKNEKVDAQIRDRFLSLHEHLAAGAAERLAEGPAAHDEDVALLPRPLLACVVILDQFSRNLFRGSPRAFAADPTARRLSRTALQQGFDLAMKQAERLFLYMPFEHSESREDQALSIALFSRLGNEQWTGYALAHQAVIDRFGRFPHRNAVLERPSSAEEVAFLRESSVKWF